MAKLSDVVEVSVSANTRTPTQQGFGTELLLAYHAEWVENYRRYTDVDALVDDGFDSDDPTYLMVEAAFSQDPRPPAVLVGRLPSAHTHTQTITITSAVEGAHVQFQVREPATGEWVDIDYTILAAATTTTVATAVELLVEAVTGVASSSAIAVVTVTPTTPGDVIFLRGPDGGAPVNCTFAETTADAGYDDQLTVIYGQTKDFYGVCLDTNSHTNVDLVAAWTEARTLMFGYQTSDHAEKAGTGTLASGLQTSAYKRTWGKFVEDPSEYSQVGWMAKCFAKTAGSITWMFKEVAGDTPVTLTDTEETNLDNVNLNYTVRLNARNFVRPGKMADGTFIDITHGKDALTARIQEKVFGSLIDADKRPYEDVEVDGVCADVLSVLRQFETIKFLRKNTSTCTGPLVDDIDDADKSERLLPDIKFGAQLGGAFHKIRIAGTLSL